jgi:hypothetical protein
MSENQGKSVFRKLKAEFQTWRDTGRFFWKPWFFPIFRVHFEHIWPRAEQAIIETKFPLTAFRKGFFLVLHFVAWGQQLQTYKNSGKHRKKLATVGNFRVLFGFIWFLAQKGNKPSPNPSRNRENTQNLPKGNSGTTGTPKIPKRVIQAHQAHLKYPNR